MADGIAQRYGSVIRQQMERFATWTPQATVTVGDYGPLNGALFDKMNNLGPLKSTTSPGVAGYDLTFGAKRSFNFNAEARAKYNIAEGKALLEVGFSTESALMFSTPDAVVTRVDDIEALGRQLVDRYRDGNWDLAHGIVVEVTKVSKATILLSEKSNATANFSVEANTPLSAAAMANLNANTSLVDTEGVGVKVVGEGPLTPLFRLAFLRKVFLHDPKIEIRGFTNFTESAQEQHKIAEERYLEVY